MAIGNLESSSRDGQVNRNDIKVKARVIARLLLNKNSRRREKVFAIGFNKTGTTSLHSLFESIGLSSFHGVKWRACDDLMLLRSYDCFSDGIPKDLAFLDRTFPNSKFILQVRDLDTWIYSRLAHIEREKERNRHKGGPLWDNTEHSIKHWIKQRNEHHLAVLSFFSDRPSDLLIVNFIRDELAAERICSFLGYEGRYGKPRTNINPKKEFSSESKKMFRKCIVELGVDDSELSHDILCRSLIGEELRDLFPVDTDMLDQDAPKKLLKSS